jgi:DNA repair exonuclease SbcCD nuclease subunit
MLKLLHTADWQIGRQYGRFAPEDATALAEARLLTVETIAALARDRQVDVVLVAGDVFDAQTVSDRTIRRLFNALSQFAGPWVLLPGNHDAALAESVWTRALRLGAVPEHVHLALTPEPLTLAEQGLVILPAPLTQRQTVLDLTDWFDDARTPPGLLRVGLAHGSVQGVLPEEIDSPNPIAADRAASARLDYLALGDWHGMRQLDARTWYSGTPEPERFKDNAPGHVLIVELAQPGATPVVDARVVARHHWRRVRQTLAVESDVRELADMLARVPDAAVLALELGGSIDLAGHQALDQALSVAEGRLRSLEVDQSALRLLPTDADLARLSADGYVGQVIAELRDAQRDARPDAAALAGEALNILAQLLLARTDTAA